MGIGGFVLIALGVVLALIGIRSLWYERSCIANAGFFYLTELKIGSKSSSLLAF